MQPTASRGGKVVAMGHVVSIPATTTVSLPQKLRSFLSTETSMRVLLGPPAGLVSRGPYPRLPRDLLLQQRRGPLAAQQGAVWSSAMR